MTRNDKVSVKELPEPPKIVDGTKCTCAEYNWRDHTCPYAEAMNNDFDSKCHCCPFCEFECLWDI